MVRWDPTYFDDFWTVPGYLGANPTESLVQARCSTRRRWSKPIMAAEAVALGLPLPLGDGGPGDRRRAGRVRARGAPRRRPHRRDAAVHERQRRRPQRLDLRTPRRLRDDRHRPDAVRLAARHRGRRRGADRQHRRTSPSRPTTAIRCHPTTIPEWDQFRAAGQPIYPQRPELLGPRFARNGGAGLQSGRFDGKMIVVAVPDRRGRLSAAGGLVPTAGRGGARPAHRRPVPACGSSTTPCTARRGAPGERCTPARTTRIVNYRGVLEQALRDVAAWVERGAAPPAEHELRARRRPDRRPADRGRAQGHPAGRARHRERWRARRGRRRRGGRVPGARRRAARERARSSPPSGTSRVPATSPVTLRQRRRRTRSSADRHAHVLRARHLLPRAPGHSQRRGEMHNPHGRIENLGRVRVVVS